MESLFDTVKKDADKAISKSFRGSNPEWRETSLQNLKRFCEYTETFSMNDFRDFNLHENSYHTHDNRAIGGVIKSAQTLGWVKPTGDTVYSRVGHKTRIQIWKSLIFKKSE